MKGKIVSVSEAVSLVNQMLEAMVRARRNLLMQGGAPPVLEQLNLAITAAESQKAKWSIE